MNQLMELTPVFDNCSQSPIMAGDRAGDGSKSSEKIITDVIYEVKSVRISPNRFAEKVFEQPEMLFDEERKVPLESVIAADYGTQSAFFKVGDNHRSILLLYLIIEKTSQIKKPVGENFVAQIIFTENFKNFPVIKNRLMANIMADELRTFEFAAARAFLFDEIAVAVEKRRRFGQKSADLL